jgi:hypothetical protein
VRLWATRFVLTSALGLAASLSIARAASADTGPKPADPAASPTPDAPYPPPAKRAPPPDNSISYANPHPYPTLAWAVLQLVPSPEVGFGRFRRIDGDSDERVIQATWGLRWQLTPVLWSFGVNRRVSGWRFLVVDPIARMSGSIAFEQHVEYFGGYVDRVLLRPAVNLTLPVLHRGEYLAVSMGTSVYRYDDTFRVAYDVGAYVFFGLFGVQATVAPTHDALTTIATFRIRYF